MDTATIKPHHAPSEDDNSDGESTGLELSSGHDGSGGGVQTAQEASLTLPNHELYDLLHLAKLDTHWPGEEKTEAEERHKARAKLFEMIEEGHMSDFYQNVCQQLEITVDDKLLKNMKILNEADEAALDSAIVNAKENYGDMEISEAKLKRAQHFLSLGSPLAKEKYDEVLTDKAVGPSGRLDVHMTFFRLGFFEGDMKLARESLALAKAELNLGGDWERKNRLKVYEGIFLAAADRNFEEAAKLLINGLASFTATELFSMEKFVEYIILLSVCSMPRMKVKEIAKAPEVLQLATTDYAELVTFITSIVQCDYKTYFATLVPISRRIRRDKYLAPHYRYFVCKVRLRAYAQFLEPYKSVSLASMAETFGVSEEFLNRELEFFIAARQLRCKIDGVNGTVESSLQEGRSSAYRQILQKGDELLNKIQSLSRVIDM